MQERRQTFGFACNISRRTITIIVQVCNGQPETKIQREGGYLLMTAEHDRLRQARERSAHWKRWWPYVSERAWGTVREGSGTRKTGSRRPQASYWKRFIYMI